MTLSAWKAAGRTYRHGNHDIFYRVDGDGPVLLCIHGFPSASWDWEPMWSALTARFRVVAADMIGFGFSAKPVGHAYSLFDQADLHEGLLRELGVDRCHVLSHDYGDTVAQELLARFGERSRRGEAGLTLQSLVLLNGGIFPEAHHARPLQRLLASPLGPLIGRLSNKRSFVRGLTEVFAPTTPPTPEIADGLWSLLRHNDGHRVMHKIIGYLKERRSHRDRWVGALAAGLVPQRLVDGLMDPVSGPEMVARYRALVPNPDVVELPTVGHYPQVEDAPSVIRAFRQFHDALET